VKRFYNYLVQKGVCQRLSISGVKKTTPELVVCFRDWFQKHRGAAEPTLRHYCRGAVELLAALGEDTRQWDAHRLRKFVFKRTSKCGMETAPVGTTANILAGLPLNNTPRADVSETLLFGLGARADVLSDLFNLRLLLAFTI